MTILGSVVLLVVLAAATAIVTGAGTPLQTSGDGADGGEDVGTDLAATVDGDIELSAANTTIVGELENETLGTEAVGAGDVDGDGYQDVLVSAPESDRGGDDAGAVYLVYGPVEESELSADATDVIFVGEAPTDRLGTAIAAGDVTGDGRNDVVIGAPFTAADGEAGAGAVYVFEGSELAEGEVTVDEADATLLGESQGDRAGAALDVLPANESERSGAVVVGAPLADGDAAESGAAYLFRADGLEGDRSLGAADSRFAGAEPGERAGASVAVGGNVTARAAPDLVIGAPAKNTTGANAGAVYLVASDGERDSVPLSDSRARFDGAGANDRAGFAVDGAADFDGDGYDDVLVGAPLNDSTGPIAGAAYLARGGEAVSGEIALSDADLTLTGAGAGDRAGFAVDFAGGDQHTCDGYADVLVGAPSNGSLATEAGAAYLVAGGEEPTERRTLSDVHATLRGTAANESAGTSVAPAFDADGDGALDVLVGAPGADVGAPGAGAAYVVHGDCAASESGAAEIKTGSEPDETTPLADGDVPSEDDGTPTPESQTPTSTPTPTQTPSSAPDSDSNLDRVSPAETITVEPGTTVIFQVGDPDGELSVPRWTVDDQRAPVHPAYAAEYHGQTGNHYMTYMFDSTGTHEVAATGGDPAENEPAMTWTVQVQPGGATSPNVDDARPDPDSERTAGPGEETEYAVDVSHADGNLEQVVWWMGQHDVVVGTDAVGGASATSAQTMSAHTAYNPEAWVITSDGTFDRVIWDQTTIDDDTPAEGEDATISITALDNRSSATIDADVTVSWDGGQISGSTEFGEPAEFVLEGVEPGSDTELEITASRYEYNDATVTTTLTDSVDVRLEPAARVTIEIVDAGTGAGIPNAQVSGTYAAYQSGEFSGTTDANGELTIAMDGVSPHAWREAQLEFSVSHPDYEDTTVSRIAYESTVEMQPIGGTGSAPSDGDDTPTPDEQGPTPNDGNQTADGDEAGTGNDGQDGATGDDGNQTAQSQDSTSDDGASGTEDGDADGGGGNGTDGGDVNGTEQN